MPFTVQLTVLTGSHKGDRYDLHGPATCTVGRAPDCEVSLYGTEADRRISRKHCQLHVDPPVVRVQDLGSRNGTYVNGRTVEALAEEEQRPELFETKAPIGTLRPGDVLTIGGTSLRVDVVDPAAPKMGEPNMGEPAHAVCGPDTHR